MTLKTKIFMLVTILALLVGSIYGNQTFKELKQYKYDANMDAKYWTGMQSNAIHSFDYAVAGALSTSSVHKRQTFLDDAINEASYLARYSFYGPSAVYFIAQIARSNYSAFWAESGKYLAYARSEEGPSLKPSQLQNLQLIRKNTMTIRPYIENLDKALYEKGSNEKKTNAKIEQITAQLISRLGELPEIGKNDKALNDFWYSKYPYKIRNGIIFDGEKKYNGSELARRAKAFMGELWSNQQNIVSDGGRGDNIFGEEVTFVAKDKKSLSSPYRVSITNTGGHIVSVQLGDQKGMKYDEPAGKMDKKAAVLYAQEFIGRWGEESLELHQFEDKTSIYRLVFVPIKENIPVIQQKVEIVIDPVKGRLVQFDASNYFRYYKQDFPLRPKLSPEEAANKLNKTLRISGAPVLEVKDGDLVYAIPVKGIDLVRHIYINAINGDEEGFDYVT